MHGEVVRAGIAQRTGRFRILFGLLALAVAAAAGAVTPSGSVGGLVVLAGEGTPLPGAAVTLTDEERGTILRGTSDTQGMFTIPLVRPGRYTVSVQLSQFKPWERHGVTVSVGRETWLRVELQPGFSEGITVTGQAAPLDPTRTFVASEVTPQQVEELPLATRDYLQLAFLAPGVQPSRDVGFGGVVSSLGQEARSSFLYVDGAENNSFVLGGPGTAISQDAVQEFQVLTHTFTAEFGRTQSAVINVITKSGSNELHGSAYSYYRDQDLAAPSWFTGKKEPFRRTDWGGTLGGPILRNRLFYFLSFEDVSVKIPTTVDIAARPDVSGTVPVTTDNQLLLGKLDFTQAENIRWALSYRFQDTDEANVDVGGPNTASYGYARHTKVQGALADNQYVSGGAFFNEGRLTWYDFDQRSTPNSTEVGEQRPSYFAGQNPRFPQGGTERRIGLSDTASWDRERFLGIGGHHLVKVGVDLSHWTGDVYFDLFSTGQFVFTSDDPKAPPYLFIRGTGDSSTRNTVDFYSFFVQDEWRPTPRWTLNLGLRWDLQDGANNSGVNPKYPFLKGAPPDRGHVQPRLGFAYDVGGRGRAVLRGGAGVYYSQIFNVTSINEDIFNGEKFRIAVFPCYAVPGGCDVHNPPPPEQMLGLPPDIRANEEAFKTPYTVQGTLGGSFDLGLGWILDVDAVYSRGFHELMEYRENLRLDPNDPSSPRPHPEVGSIRRVHSAGSSKYRALLLNVRRRLADHWQLQAAYTLSKCTNEAEFYAIAAGDSRAPNPAKNDRGPCRQDQRHRLTVNATYLLPLGFTVSTIVTAASGQPWSVRLGYDANLDDSADQDRPPGVGRNSERSNTYFRWDLRLTKRFHIGPVSLDLIAEVFNLTNHRNYDPGTYSNVVSSPDFGRPRASSNELYQPRQIQLAAKVVF